MFEVGGHGFGDEGDARGVAPRPGLAKGVDGAEIAFVALSADGVEGDQHRMLDLKGFCSNP